MKLLSCLLVLKLVSAAGGAPLIVEDVVILRSLRDELGKAVEQERAVGGERLAEMGREAPARLEGSPEIRLAEDHPGPLSYEDFVRSVFVIGSIYNCGKCDKWHNRGAATAWALGGDGLFVTNRHVVEGSKGDAVGLASVDGRVFPVTGVAAMHPTADLAIIRADLGDEAVHPLRVAAGDAPVGEAISVVSHPEGRFFFRTSGEVARYHRRPGRRDNPAQVWMSITADYAKGSSGAPVVDSGGRVVGVAATTQSIYYGSRDPESEERGPLQMVVKNCVPVAALREMLPQDERTAGADPE